MPARAIVATRLSKSRGAQDCWEAKSAMRRKSTGQKFSAKSRSAPTLFASRARTPPARRRAGRARGTRARSAGRTPFWRGEPAGEARPAGAGGGTELRRGGPDVPGGRSGTEEPFPCERQQHQEQEEDAESRRVGVRQDEVEG